MKGKISLKFLGIFSLLMRYSLPESRHVQGHDKINTLYNIHTNKMPVISTLFKLFKQKSNLTEAVILIVKMFGYKLSCIEYMPRCPCT